MGSVMHKNHHPCPLMYQYVCQDQPKSSHSNFLPCNAHRLVTLCAVCSIRVYCVMFRMNFSKSFPLVNPKCHPGHHHHQIVMTLNFLLLPQQQRNVTSLNLVWTCTLPLLSLKATVNKELVNKAAAVLTRNSQNLQIKQIKHHWKRKERKAPEKLFKNQSSKHLPRK